MAHVLLVHTNPSTRSALSARLAAEGHAVSGHPDLDAALSGLQEEPELTLLEHNVRGVPAHELLSVMHSQGMDMPCIVLASPPDEVLRALREGAYFCTHAPLDLEEVAVLSERALRGIARAASVRPSAAPSQPPAKPPEIDDLLGDSAQMQAVRHAIRAVAGSPGTNVLLTGESGTGKDLVARIIHQTTAPQRSFLSLACSTLPEAQLETELFGGEVEGKVCNGLLEQADGGTIFIDEIEALPASTQAKLLRFAEDKTFRRVGSSTDSSADTRIIAATRRDVQASFGEGRLREDLLHRLAVVTIPLPPLRERKDDIPVLVRHYLTKFSTRFGKRVVRVSGSALSLLQEHYWPGNVRELCNTLERATLLASGDVLESSHISFSPGSKPPPGRFRLPPQGIDFRELEREVVAQALDLAKGNQTRAASLLHMTRDQIRYRMAKFGITDSNGGPAELTLEPPTVTPGVNA
ncbi:MAG TPA: sigma-54 dependent transcriptional regulator [Polyangiaceae bacterium]|nr:sigma-54 dependent transcriptional regulator [Polyangiaceae bacterium]